MELRTVQRKEFGEAAVVFSESVVVAEVIR